MSARGLSPAFMPSLALVIFGLLSCVATQATILHSSSSYTANSTQLAAILDPAEIPTHLYAVRGTDANLRLPIASVFALVLHWVSVVWKEEVWTQQARYDKRKCHRGVCLVYAQSQALPSTVSAWLVLRAFGSLWKDTFEIWDDMPVWGNRFYDARRPSGAMWTAAIVFQRDDRPGQPSDFFPSRQVSARSEDSGNGTADASNEVLGAPVHPDQVRVRTTTSTRAGMGPSVLVALWLTIMSSRIWIQDHDKPLALSGMPVGATFVSPVINNAALRLEITGDVVQRKPLKLHMLERGLLLIWDNCIIDTFRGELTGNLFLTYLHDVFDFATLQVRWVDLVGEGLNNDTKLGDWGVLQRLNTLIPERVGMRNESSVEEI